ncbi:hypothetical protein [Pseudarthrobacter sp. ATCC 49987]|uniref:hypothetical protein n=1 Tax=Pseudarthrobacter sp. ATCC 49987 TaxID=2698204 RepID=UPI00136E7778|nr:hypothetical protein [Pseudarthrobacter sp. ATCC 49987]
MVNPILGGSHDLTQRLNQIEANIRALSTQQILLNASTGQGGGQPGISTDINGLHAFDSTGTETVTISGQDGSITIRGTLNLPNGSINNDALVNPVKPGSAGLSDPGHAYTTTSTVYAQQSIAVPTGFTQALVFLGVSGGAWNNTAAYDYLYVAGDINGSAGGSTPQGAAGSSYGSASAFAIRTLTGLSGGVITVGCRVWTGAAGWAANGANIANTNAIVQFLR